jgi:hypothetical protein
LADQLMAIHQQNFRTATKRIKKYQRRYKKNYDKKFKTKKFPHKVMTKVQYKRSEKKSVLSKQRIWSWCPVRSYYLISRIDALKKRVQLMTPEGSLLQRWHCFDNIRKYTAFK